MTKPYLALSIVAPSGQRIAQGLKTLEVRSWRPDQFPLKDLVIVENQTYLNNEGDEELGVCCGAGGFHSIHTWQENEVDAACASYWADGYYAWVISNVRPLLQPLEVRAKRKLYTLELHE